MDISGILYTLLQTKLLYPDCVTDQNLTVITTCIDKLLDLCFPSGNMPSSVWQ